jgi:BirA family biotin operon repressor/biotin-[acetyl-CoA-carboxylase] ligase
MNQELSSAVITKGLKTKIIGRKVIYLPSVPSTMDAAREEALKGAVEGTVVITGEQTAGRGRLKRQWLTPAGNIALSIILRPQVKNLPYLIMIASLAVVKSIKSITGVQGQIKWPNDILINGKKVCGILVENEVRGNKVAYSIIGIGINVNLRVKNYPEIAHTATNLKNESNQSGLRINLIRSLLQEFDQLYVKLPDGKAVYEAWRENLVTLGKKVKATWGEQTIVGIAEDVAQDGALVIRGDDGKLTKVVAGDVTLRE